MSILKSCFGGLTMHSILAGFLTYWRHRTRGPGISACATCTSSGGFGSLGRPGMILEMAASCRKQAPEIVVPKHRMMNRANIPARWLQGSDLLGEGVVGSWARDAMVGLEWEVQHVSSGWPPRRTSSHSGWRSLSGRDGETLSTNRAFSGGNALPAAERVGGWSRAAE